MARFDYRSFHPHGRCLSGANVANTRTAPAAVLERVARIEAVCERHGVPLPAAALQFPLGHPLVVSVIPGARSVAELEQNLAYSRLSIPAALWSDLKTEGLVAADGPERRHCPARLRPPWQNCCEPPRRSG
ncbi:aldo/keto reductase [Metarhizobium album]|uniref:aldo/keto reductase n=1 Tax=Metarhizobium album TaxID=2182425 RepID=UPI001402BBFB|nr:aldo/keto reductase [Rhizobium album]